MNSPLNLGGNIEVAVRCIAEACFRFLNFEKPLPASSSGLWDDSFAVEFAGEEAGFASLVVGINTILL